MPKLELYQCGGCKAIVADSGQGKQPQSDSKCAVLERCPGILKRNPPQTDKDGTFQALCCSQCKHEVGRFYSQNKDLALVKRFIITLDKVLIYTLDRPDGEDLAARVEALERLTCFLYDKMRVK